MTMRLSLHKLYSCQTDFICLCKVCLLKCCTCIKYGSGAEDSCKLHQRGRYGLEQQRNNDGGLFSSRNYDGLIVSDSRLKYSLRYLLMRHSNDGQAALMIPRRSRERKQEKPRLHHFLRTLQNSPHQ